MQRDWDERARENARHFVDTSRTDWTDQDFFASGEQAIAEQILTDTENVYQGRYPAQMRVLEIGCGAGRLTRALSNIFGEVHRLLRPGALFKFQVQGTPIEDSSPDDTWHGVCFNQEQVTAMAQRCGFDPRYSSGKGRVYFWQRFFKPPA